MTKIELAKKLHKEEGIALFQPCISNPDKWNDYHIRQLSEQEIEEEKNRLRKLNELVKEDGEKVNG